MSKTKRVEHTPGPWRFDSDARLIASAPELLEACREAIELCQAHEGEQSTDYPVIARLLQSAIARATQQNSPST